MIKVPNGDTHSNILLRDVLHTLDIALMLICIGLVSDTGYSVLFKDGMCTIPNRSNIVVGKIPKRDGLYKVEGTVCLLVSAHTANGTLTAMDTHRQLGHISLDTIKSLICDRVITSLDVLKPSLPISCDSCVYGKMM